MIKRHHFCHQQLLIWVAMIALSGLLFTSCKKTDEEPIYDFDFLYAFQRVSTLSLLNIQYIFSQVSQQYPDAGLLLSNSHYSVDVYKVTYPTYYKDSLITASGLICIPLADEKFPVISFQNGTKTANATAPSVNPSYNDYLMVEAIAGNGYIITIPDYIGYGSSSDIVHPYFNKESTNRAAIDMIKACIELIGIESITADTNGHFYLMGYSQGGGATLSVLDEIENGTYPGFEINAASCGAGAYDLHSMTEYMLDQTTIPSALYLPYFIYAHKAYGTIHDDLDIFFNEPYASRIPLLFDGSKTDAEVEAQLTNVVGDLFTSGIIDNYSVGANFAELRSVIQENSIQAWNAASYINFYHGTADLHVPPSQSSEVYNDFIGLGVGAEQVKLYELVGLTHSTGIIPWGIETVLWFNELEAK